jgi:hypothetical protein
VFLVLFSLDRTFGLLRGFWHPWTNASHFCGVARAGFWTSGTKKMAKRVVKLRFGLVKSDIEYSMRTRFGRLGKPDEIA